MIEEIATWLFGEGKFAALFVGLFTYFTTQSPYGKLWQNTSDRKRVIEKLEGGGWRPLYTRTMRPLLDRVDQALSPDELARGLDRTRVAFSHDLILWTMMFAAAYPMLAFVGQWVLGDALILADSKLAEPGDLEGLAYFWIWLGCTVAMCVLATVRSRWRSPLLMLAVGISSVGIPFAERFNVPLEVAGAVGVSVGIATTSAGVGVSALAVSFSGAFAGAGAVAVAGVLASALAFATTLTSTLAVALAGAGAVAGAVAIRWFQQGRGYHPAYWIAFCLLILGAVIGAIMTAPILLDSILVVFFGVFPIFNALADFASIGLTRFLLRDGLDNLTWRNALIDLMGGALIFCLLGVSLITYVHLVHPQDGVPLLDLTALFNSLETSPSDNWWLFVMLFSTVVPTILHGMIGVYTVLLHYPDRLRRQVVRWLASGAAGSDVDGWRGSMTYCLMLTLSIWLPLWATWHIFTFDHGWVLQQIIAGFRTYAELIGAL